MLIYCADFIMLLASRQSENARGERIQPDV